MISSFFSTRGPLSKKLTHYITRDAQVEMAEAVVCAIDKKEQLLVEAETGTGKTFAYLAPALLSYNKNNDASIIISTGSKALQEQLYLKDLPLLIETTGFTGSVSLLKGRSNYLCRERFNRFILESQRKEKALQITLVK